MTADPAWSWKEVVIATGLMLPALLIGSVVAVGAGWLILGQSPTAVQVAIPGQFAGYALWLGGVLITLYLLFTRAVHLNTLGLPDAAS